MYQILNLESASIPIFQVEKVRHSEVVSLAQGHADSNVWVKPPDTLALEAEFLPLYYPFSFVFTKNIKSTTDRFYKLKLGEGEEKRRKEGLRMLTAFFTKQGVKIQSSGWERKWRF